MKIFLIGMPGAGKSTFGKQLAAELSVPFIDLDDTITQKEGRSIPEIFRESGEMYFRKIEAKQLHHWATQQESFVMATGGGAPCYHSGMTVINNFGTSIFLNPPLDVLKQRMEGNGDRPLLHGLPLEDKLESLYKERVAIYKKATLEFTGDAPDMQEVLSKLKM